MTVTAPDLATFHEQFLSLRTKAEEIRDALYPESPPELQELIDEIERYVQPLEDILDAEMAREALKEGRLPWTRLSNASGSSEHGLQKF